MTRRYTPAGELLTTVLAGRVDAIEEDLRNVTGDLTAIGRGVTDLTVQIRHLAADSIAHEAGAAGATAEDDDFGQPDWFAIEDTGQAQDAITALSTFVDTVLCHYGITLPAPCWPLHPSVVGDLLALAEERAAAYAAPKPTAVSEFLGRWLPATRDRITTALGPCAAERGHRVHGRTYDTTGFDALSAAAWWATERHIPAPEAFALAPLT